MAEQEQDQGQRPCTENIGSGVRDPLQLWAKVHRGNKEGTGDSFEGALGSHKKSRDRNQQSQSTPGLDTTSSLGGGTDP